MLNMRVLLSQVIGVLTVFSITSVALGQQDQQAGSVLSESDTIKIIREIHQIEKNMIKQMHDLDLKMRDHVDNKISSVNEKITNMNRELGSLKSTAKYTFWISSAIGVPVILYFLTLTFPELLFWRRKKQDAQHSIDEKQDELANYVGIPPAGGLRNK